MNIPLAHPAGDVPINNAFAAIIDYAISFAGAFARQLFYVFFPQIKTLEAKRVFKVRLRFCLAQSKFGQQKQSF